MSTRPEFPSGSSIHSSRPLFCPALATLALLLGLAAFWPTAAAADPTYGVMNAPEGVYWRSEPNWAAAVRVTGFGVYNGTVVEVHCYQSGTSVEGSADTMWEQATDVGGPGYGSGWLNEHFINDGQPINEHSPGVPPCGATPAPPPPPPPPPAAGGLVFSIFNAEGGIYYRYGPHWLETTSTPGVGVYDGDQVELICGAFGDPVGPYADTAWSKVRNLSRPVGEGWVNEHFINDGVPDNGFVAGETMCQPGGSGSGSSSGDGGSGATPTGVQFNRGATVAWGKAHAEDKPPHPASCTWFVSQALWAGGLPKTSEWTSAGSHGLLFQKRPGTVAAWAVPNFISYILKQYPRSAFTQLNLAGNKVPAAQPGDVIAYDWEGKSSTTNRSNLEHVSLVTGIASGQYPEISEWSIYDGTQPTPYVSRGWTWSTKTHQWLQKEYPKVQAFLLHIKTGG